MVNTKAGPIFVEPIGTPEKNWWSGEFKGLFKCDTQFRLQDLDGLSPGTLGLPHPAADGLVLDLGNHFHCDENGSLFFHDQFYIVGELFQVCLLYTSDAADE